MLPINPSQNTQPSLASYFPRLASSFSDAGVQVHSTAEIYDAVRSVMQINYGLINIPTVGSHNEITVHYHSTGSDAQLLREILRPLQSMAMQPNNAPLASLGIEGLQKKYLESLQKDREIKDALVMYVAPECTLITNTKERFSLEEKVRDFLASKENKVLLLLGVAGSGKSTFNRYLARSLWEAYDKEANKSGQTPIPLFIRLSSLEKPNTNLISEYLKEEKFTEEQIADLKANYRFIFILDGYDEIKDRTRLFYIENELDEWQAKVIVTSRPEYLGDRYERQFHPKKQPHLLQTYQLAPFSDLSIEEYVNKYKSSYPELEKSVSGYGEILERSEVKELIRNPFLLKLSLSELPALAKKYKGSSQRITRLALYEQFVESWFERSQDRLSGIRLTGAEQKAFHFLNKDFTKHGTKFSKYLAIEMYQAGLVRVTYSEQISYDESNAAEQDWRDKFLSDSNEKIKLLRFNAPLIYRDDQYEFIHKSIQDYLVARALWEEFSAHGKTAPSSWLNTLDIVNDPEVLQFLAERVQQARELKGHLLRVVEQSKGAEGVQFERGAANAITVLVRADVQFNEADLKGIRIPRADLSGGVFDSAQLQGADLRKVNFRATWLRNANLSSAQMAGVQFGELPFLKEESGVLSCAYSRDGKLFAAGLENGNISVYAALRWVKIFTLRGHTERVESVAYSPKGDRIVSGSRDKIVRVWDANSEEVLHILEGHSNWIWSVAYSPTDNRLASGGRDKSVRIWDANSGATLRVFCGHSADVGSVVYSSTGEKIASSSEDKIVHVWNPNTGEVLHTLHGHSGGVTSLAYSPADDQIAAGSWDGAIQIWNACTGDTLQILCGHSSRVQSLAYSSTGQRLVSSGQDVTVRVWDVTTGKTLQILRGHNRYPSVNCVAYSSNDDQIVSGSIDQTVRLWNINTETFHQTFNSHHDNVTGVAYSPKGDRIASSSRDGTVRIWDRNTGAVLQTLRSQPRLSSVAYSSKEGLIATGSYHDAMQVWDLNTGEVLRTLRGHSKRVENIAYSPKGDQIASAGYYDKVVEIWNVEPRQLLHVLTGHTHKVMDVAYSPKGSQIASASIDQTVRVWDANSGEVLHILKGHNKGIRSVAYSPQGDQIASGSIDHTVKVWDLNNENVLQTFCGHSSWVISVVYSPQGDRIASASDDMTVRVWDIATGQCQLSIQGFSESVASIDWKEIDNSDYLVTGSEDGAVRQWKLIKEDDQYKAILCWASAENVLTLAGTIIEGVQGLSEVNERLLTQRGAVGEAFWG